MMLHVLFVKEMIEQWRTRRLLILVSVSVVLGLASPLIAKLSPELVKSLAASQPGVVITLPPPTLAEGLAQYVKNISQLGALTVILLGLAAVAGEKTRGTALFTLSRPAGRGCFLLAKFAAQLLVLGIALVPAAAGCYAYSMILFGPPPIGVFVAINGLLLLHLAVVDVLTLLASTLSRSISTAAALAAIGVLLLIVTGAIPLIAPGSPARLIAWAGGLASGEASAAVPAVVVSLLSLPAMLLVAWLRFRREEL